MFKTRIWTQSSRRLSILLLAVVVPPAATLAWLGTELAARDRVLVAERDRERRDATVQAVVHTVHVRLGEAAQVASDAPLPDGMVRVIVSGAGIAVDPSSRLLWHPTPQPGVSADTGVFAQAEESEYRGNSPDALRQYDTLARSPHAAVRAGALLRQARVHRGAARWDAALGAYRELASIPDVAIDGAPADLQAHRAICDVLQAAGRARDLEAAASALIAEFLSGRWSARIDRSIWVLTKADLERWAGRPLTLAPDGELFSMAADAIWGEIGPIGHATGTALGWRAVMVDSTPVTTFVDPQRTTVLFVSPVRLSEWLQKAADEVRVPARLTVVMSSDASEVRGSSIMLVPASESGLPWTLALEGDFSTGARDLESRRRLIGTGMIAMLLLLCGTSYFLWRVMARELAVARLQTEFVSAVSHEFRTPLTSIRHVTELLEESDELSVGERKAFYGALARSTDRLQRFVESLLDFSRLEAGRRSYELRPLDTGGLAAELAEDLCGEVVSSSHRIELECGAGSLVIRADRTALAHALRNVLDNAVKYSPGSAEVFLTVRRRGSDVVIAVRDTGLGIPAHEQKDIFGRFVRGRSATHLGIAGTGLGLAMVLHIVEAHGGRVEVQSVEGQGSTFSLVLPAVSGVADIGAALDSGHRDAAARTVG